MPELSGRSTLFPRRRRLGRWVSNDQEGGLDQLLVPIYVDPDGNAVGVEDVFTKLEAARKRYGAVGLGTDYVDRFVR